MADDRGDDLFEDLDKFFAPIKDVDWDEPDEPATPAGQDREPREEHVSVQGGMEPGGVPASETMEEPSAPIVLGEPEPEVATEGQGDGDDEGGKEDALLDPRPLESNDRDTDGAEADREPTEVLADDVTIVPDEPPAVPTGQTGLFEGSSEQEGALAEHAISDTGEAGFWEGDDQRDEEGGPHPSEEDLEAAAEHFAGSVREERYDTEPTTLEGGWPAAPEPPPTGGDLLSDLGADEVEQDILSDLDERDTPHTIIVGTEGISGPSWQEPASVEVGPDSERRGLDGGERDVPAAFMTGAALAAVAIVSVVIGSGAFAIVAGIIVLLAQGELFGVMVKHHHQPATAIGLVTGALMTAGAYYRGTGAIPAVLALGVVATFMWFMTEPPMQRKNILLNAGLTILNMAWIPMLAGYLIVLSTYPDGRALVIAVVGLTFLYDTAAFLAGTVVGGAWFRRGMAPATSPKKSWEGFIAATIVTLFASVAFVSSFVEPLNDQRVNTMLLGLVVAVAATLGDLAESLVKRDLNVKDMSTILPGHGGVLDRIDSLLFVAPAAFLLLDVLGVV